ncbi:MAG: 4Fe-4S dicluster domain-containing protein [Adlercreutzia equolifaciens]
MPAARCTAGCPARAVNRTTSALAHAGRGIPPFRSYDQADRIVEAVQGGLWDCTMCGTCTAHCNQLEIDHLAIWQKLRDAATERGLVKHD